MRDPFGHTAECLYAVQAWTANHHEIGSLRRTDKRLDGMLVDCLYGRNAELDARKVHVLTTQRSHDAQGPVETRRELPRGRECSVRGLRTVHPDDDHAGKEFSIVAGARPGQSKVLDGAPPRRHLQS